jgi:cobalt-zinc-cadmium efflux system membrane fusion protein
VKRQLLAAVLVVATHTACSTSEKTPVVAAAAPAQIADETVIPENSPKLNQIRTENVSSAAVPIDDVSAPGQIEANPNRQSKVLLPISGRVTSVAVKIGDFVRQGQALLTVESSDADAAVSGYQQAQAAVTQAKSAQAKAQMDLDREKDLYEHGAVPQKDVFSAQAISVQADTSVSQSVAAAEQARRRLEILGITPGAFGQRVTVHAPISGKILEMSVANGEFRNDLNSAVMTIADLSAVWATSDVPETAIRLVKVGQPVSIQLAAYPGETFKGRVALIGDVVDPQTRTVKVRAELTNPDGRLKPDMFAHIQLAEATKSEPTIPASALISTEGKTVVWREKSRGVFQRVAVTTGTQVGNRVAVLSGLMPNDRIVVDGGMLLAAN